jgi:dipeptidyl-peptidase-4
MKNTFLLLVLILGGLSTGMSQKKITLEEIWRDYNFIPRSLPGFNFQNDGKHYTRLERNKIEQYDLLTGELTQTLFDPASISGDNKYFNGQIDGYAFSDDETKLLVWTESERIYRHSRQAYYFVYNRKSGKLQTIFEDGKQRYATFNPQASKVAFVYENNMYYYDLKRGDVVQITNDGKENSIINGGTDWVYEEEFGFDRGFQWSPDGNSIAFYRFDESKVSEFTMTNYRNELYPEYVTFKYPKVGEENALVTIHLYDVGKDLTIDAVIEQKSAYYIPRIKWTNDPSKLCVTRMNRHQNALELILVDAKSGKASNLLVEKNKYYIDIHDNLTFLEDGKHFLWTSEQDGWNHIYMYDMNGKMVRQLTKGQWEVTAFYGLDEALGRIYYQAADQSPLQRQIYSINLEGGDKQTLAGKAGWNTAQFSSTFDYFVNNYRNANSPSLYEVYNRSGKLVRVIEDNQRLRRLQSDYGLSPVEFFEFKSDEGVSLNGWMIKPPKMQPNKKYPVFMYLYGGPGSQQVTDSWKGQNYWWFQMLAQQGYIVACVDNRGTGARGEEFKKMTYLQLGHYETIDQIAAAKYLGSLDYTDSDRIGIFGWSYGGYMSSLCLLKGNDVFKAAIAVAPVTNWKWYDTIYTERYMRTEAENEEGYEQNSPVNFADQLKGDYLLVHGMGDDNVHFQHTAEMANALIKANKQYDTYFYPNRHHGISGGTTRLHLYHKMTNFLNENLKGKKDKMIKKPAKKGNVKLKVAPSERPLKE